MWKPNLTWSCEKKCCADIGSYPLIRLPSWNRDQCGIQDNPISMSPRAPGSIWLTSNPGKRVAVFPKVKKWVLKLLWFMIWAQRTLSRWTTSHGSEDALENLEKGTPVWSSSGTRNMLISAYSIVYYFTVSILTFYIFKLLDLKINLYLFIL